MQYDTMVKQGDAGCASMGKATEDSVSQFSTTEVAEGKEFDEGGAETSTNRQQDEPTKRKTILNRETAINNPMMMDAIRRTRLGLKGREVTGKLTFVVPKNKALNLPPTREGSPAAVRQSLCRRFECLHPSRREDDASYFEAIDNGIVVTLITALPSGYKSGGWRCHVKKSSSEAECLQVNRVTDEYCAGCQQPKPNLRPEFEYLRLLPRGMRRQRKEYERIIKQCDHELGRCISSEREAAERVATFERQSDIQEQESAIDDTSKAVDESVTKSTPEAEETPAQIKNESIGLDEILMMDVDLVQEGTWQRVNARALLPMMASRKAELTKRLASARAELAIMIHAIYDMAVPHVQRVVRRYLVRCRLDEIRKSVLEFARFSGAVSLSCVACLYYYHLYLELIFPNRPHLQVEIQRIMRSKLGRQEANRQRIRRGHFMATRIQSMARRRAAVLERARLYTIWMEILRKKSATIIQSLYRCHASKIQAQILTEERRKMLKEQEKARVASVEKDSVTIIQKHCRRILATAKCANRKIELGLHRRVSELILLPSITRVLQTSTHTYLLSFLIWRLALLLLAPNVS